MEEKTEIKTPIEKIVEHAVEKEREEKEKKEEKEEKTPIQKILEHTIKKPTEKIMSHLKEKGEKFKYFLGDKLHHTGEKMKEIGEFLHGEIKKHREKIHGFTYLAATFGLGGMMSNLLGHNPFEHMHTINPEIVKTGLETLGVTSVFGPHIAKGIRNIGYGISKFGKELKKPTEKIKDKWTL